MICFDNISIATIRSGKGDCIHLHINNQNVIIDTGPTSFAGEFRKLCNDILSSGESLDVLIISHYDDDHIGGILRTGDIGFKSVYFNVYTGTEENAYLSAIQNQRLFYLLDRTVVHTPVLEGDSINLSGLKITVCSPNEQLLISAEREMKKSEIGFLSGKRDWEYTLDELMRKEYPAADTSISNKASIVLIIEDNKHRFLFCGDAWSDNIPGGSFELIKLPHHGSIRNISDKLLERIECHKFLICADGTRHPNKQTIAKLLSHYGYITIYSNYNWWDKGFLRDEDKKYITNESLKFVLTSE